MKSGESPFTGLYLVVFKPLSHDPPISDCILPPEQYEAKEAGGHSHTLSEPINRKAIFLVCFCACL